MFMNYRFNLSVIMCCTAAILLTAGCSDDDDQPENPQPTQEETIAAMIDEVREATASYHDYEAGKDAGWNLQLSDCVAHPELGGMGFHYGRMEYMDGRVNYLEPQVLLYAPAGEEEMEFVGVEYIVPFEILPEDSEPPVLFFHEFRKNPMQEIWALHVWTEKHNPSGMFADWNPDVSCE